MSKRKEVEELLDGLDAVLALEAVDDVEAVVEGILNQIKQLKVRIVDCERLESLCQ